MITNTTQTMPIKLSIVKLNSISIPPEKYTLSRTLSTDSKRDACSDSNPEKDADSKTMPNKTTKQQNLENELSFDREIERILAQAKLVSVSF
jgi:hypothetical protein